MEVTPLAVEKLKEVIDQEGNPEVPSECCYAVKTRWSPIHVNHGKREPA
ncbi:MAG: hypothetical protein Ct9H300mP27_04910 [Chloroflexota bacterium]|nr:MAG: hypothetical protein Ct9H300mP27_04910 [Chloroflexota bacterium]